jgi:DNA (cytosine-5)-methyltransferase 1
MYQRDFMDIELFPCAGGMAKGFKDAGVDFDLAIEWLENHCDSYEQNIGHRPVQMDVTSFYELLQMGWRPPKRIRLLVADPPCTPWSRAGKRMGTDDPRDMLEGTCKIISILQPDVYLIGNVPGLDDGPNLHIVQKHIGSLSRFGYCTADFARLDAANYGVPQHRHRPFWFGHKAGPCIMWPRPTHCDPDELAANLTLPGVEELKPWITCRQALGHLSLEELGRPIKLRKRMQNSVQPGSVGERPARVVGTSNLSDGNVLLNDDQPRAGKKGKNHGTPQGKRLTSPDAAAPTITRTLHHTVIDAKELVEAEDDWNEHGPMYDYTKPLELQEGVPVPKKKVDKRPPETKAQGKRVGSLDKPSKTVTAKPSRKGAGEHAVFTLQPNRGQTLSTMDSPAPAVVRNTHGNASILVVNKKHRPPSADEPSNTVRSGGAGHSAPPVVIQMEPHHPPSRIDEPAMTQRAGSGGGANRCLQLNGKHPPSQLDKPAATQGAKPRQGSVITASPNHPASSHDAPANTLRASDGEGSNRALEWPWDRPATTVCADERLGAPGHHAEEWIQVDEGDGVVISEKAAAILQGFPDGWVFVGESKKKRWSQIGQAMPPPLANAVATSVVTQIAKTPHDELVAARNRQRLPDQPMLTVLRGGE